MFKWLKSLLTTKETNISINGVQIYEVLALIKPENYIIGVRRGAIRPHELAKLARGETFMFDGDKNDFVILPKTSIKEHNNG